MSADKPNDRSPSGPPEPDAGGRFEPTDRDLRALADHWAGVLLARATECHESGSYSSWEAGEEDHADGRLAALAAVLGRAEVERAVDRAEAAERRRMGPDRWRDVMTRGWRGRERAGAAWHGAARHLDRAIGDAGKKARAAAALGADPGGAFLDPDGDLWWFSQGLGEGRPDGRLELQVRTRFGFSATDPGCHIERPKGWVPPYGLR